jgi:hypothetical protein
LRNCPPWFQSALTRIGGVNQYNEPVFRLDWLQDEGTWALMLWESAEVAGGPYEAFLRDFWDDELHRLIVPYPKYGSYRILQKFIHREIVEQAVVQQVWDGPIIRNQIVQAKKMRTYRMEPCGFMLDVMLPMLKAWRRLSGAQKVAALKQQEQMRKDEYSRQVKDARDGNRLGRVMRSSQLVQKRAEQIERGFRMSVAAAAQWGLGMAMTGE